jgi:hypothetical protein
MSSKDSVTLFGLAIIGAAELDADRDISQKHVHRLGQGRREGPPGSW